MAIKRFNKKAIFFTFISISIVAMILIIATTSKYSAKEQGPSVIRTRINVLDNHVIDLENSYLERALYAVSYKAMASILIYLDATNTSLGNLSLFEEVVLNGTINGANIDNITAPYVGGKRIMENNTLRNWTDKISAISMDTLKANTTLIIHKVNLTQTQPWYFDVNLNISVIVNSSFASWKRDNRVVRAQLDITNFDDPYYIINNNTQQKIKKSSVPYNKWNLTALREHIHDRTYVVNVDDAPSFISRLLNDTTSSACCGIESIVNSTTDENESYVDYQYWSHKYAASCTSLFNISNPTIPDYPYLKMDGPHTQKYNVAANSVKTC